MEYNALLPHHQARGTMAKITILIAEDNHDTQYFLRVQLESEGFLVITADDGARAIDLLTEVRPDVIVTDLMMPNVSGGEVIRHVRKTANLAKIPIIVMSAYGDDYQSEASEAGATVVLQKPLDGDRLVETIKRVLSGDTPAMPQ